jgi:4-aminobutyrate aminotransferase
MIEASVEPVGTWMARRDAVPAVWSRYTDLIVERGSGAWIETITGERYLDYTSGIAVTSTGHSHPAVVAAIAEQAATIIHAQQNILFHKPGLRLHEELPRRFPGGGPARLFLSNSGAEAVEAAVKLAKIATRRPGIIAFEGGFHGRTHGAMALTSSSAKYRSHFEPLMGGVYHVPYAEPGRWPGASPSEIVSNVEGAINALFARFVHPDEVAAFVVEPILGEGGYVIPPDDFLPALRRIADEHGILLIVDEVQTGFGRTGRFFASEWSDTTPDILVLGKGIASGLPLSGILARGELLDAFSPGTHGGTYGGNAVASAAALATLKVIDEENLVAKAEELGERMLTSLRNELVGTPCIADIRGRGLMLAIEFADPASRHPRGDLATAVVHHALDEHLLLLTCGVHGQVVRIVPPLVTTDGEIDLAVEAIVKSVRATEASA